MLIEIINVAVLTAAAAAGGFASMKLMQSKTNQNPIALPEHEGSIRWNWQRFGTGIRVEGKNGGFKCPKCLSITCNTKQPRLCECHEYPRDHFHFKCKDCFFASIMRTADDR